MYKVAHLVKIIFIFFFIFINASHSQNKALDSLSRKATDPTSIVWQLQFEDFYIPVLAKEKGEQNTFRIRVIVPLKGKDPENWNHLIRFTFNHKKYNDVDPGWSDFQLFDLIIPKKYDWGAWSIGPLVSIPTASEGAYGTGKYSVGLASGVSLNNPNMGPWQLDVLIEYLVSVAGKSDRRDVSEMVLQPSLTYHLENGFYLETEPVYYYSFETKEWLIPFDIRFGKVFIINGNKYNTYIEPETTLYSNMDNYPKFGCRFGFRFIL